MEVIPDDSLPMQGQEVIPLILVGTSKIINYGLDKAGSVYVRDLIVTPEVHKKAML